MARKWKQHKPSADEWMKKMWQIDTMEYLAMKSSAGLIHCSNMGRLQKCYTSEITRHKRSNIT